MKLNVTTHITYFALLYDLMRSTSYLRTRQLLDHHVLSQNRSTYAMVLPNTQRIRPSEVLLYLLRKLFEMFFLEVRFDIIARVPYLVNGELVFIFDILDGLVELLAMTLFGMRPLLHLFQ